MDECGSREGGEGGVILVEGEGADKCLVSGARRRGHTKVVTAELIMGLPDEVAQVLSPEKFTFPASLLRS